MTKLFLITALMTLCVSAFSQEVPSGDTANETCDVRVVPTGGEPAEGSSASTGNNGSGTSR